MMSADRQWVIKSFAEKMTETDGHGGEKSVPRNQEKANLIIA